MTNRFIRARKIAWFIAFAATGSIAVAQTPPKKVEPGLEKAVRWQWRVEPGDTQDWVPSDKPTPTPTLAESKAPVVITNGNEPPSIPKAAPVSVPYTVQSGDRLVRIAKTYGVTVEQIKQFNKLTSDLIRVGQELRIPSPEEARAVELMPVAVAVPAKGKAKGPVPTQGSGLLLPQDFVLQVFLDRNGFSSGPISGEPNSDIFHKILLLYRLANPETDFTALSEQARKELGDGLADYVLKEEDLKLIDAPRLVLVPTPVATGKKPKKKSTPPKPIMLPLTYEEMAGSRALRYRTPWEFVAERFHCDEAFLKRLNPQIEGDPLVGSKLKVPDVEPFEVVNSVKPPIQPPPNTESPITAAIYNLELLVISQKEKPIAVLPISTARPGLRGKGTWKVLNAIPSPRLATVRERKERTPTPTPMFGTRDAPTPPPAATAPTVLTADEFLPPGPNNPVGIFWINLAKADSDTPLPFGLHGASVPDQLKNLESLGGFRLTNWDIAAAARLLPMGTLLEWKTEYPAPAPITPPTAPAAAPPIAVPIPKP